MTGKLAIIIPCYNEGERLLEFLRGLDRVIPEVRLASHGSISQVDAVVIDDGSVPDLQLAALLRGKVQSFNISTLRHPSNLGQGAALQTGIQYARDRLKADLFVTLDSDGQHRPEDLPAMLEALEREKADIVFGNRFVGTGPAHIPPSRKLLLKLAICFESILTGVRLGDAHNGYRVFRRSFAELLDLKQNRMAHATEFKQVVRDHGLRYAECPVEIFYTDETLAKGQRNLGFLSILKELMSVYLFQK